MRSCNKNVLVLRSCSCPQEQNKSTVPNEKEEDRMCRGLTVQSPESRVQSPESRVQSPESSRGRNKNGDQRLVSADDNPTFPTFGINKYSSGKD